MSDAYDRVKQQHDEMHDHFYALLDSCDAYASLVDALREAEENKPEPNPELIRRFTHQRREVDELIERLETSPLESLLHIGDRILMIRETEAGRFF